MLKHNCLRCDEEYKITIEDYHYLESGPDNLGFVMLRFIAASVVNLLLFHNQLKFTVLSQGVC